jgi:hypothetical protein
MAQDDVVHHSADRQPEEVPTPVVHHPTTPDRSSSVPRSAKATGDAAAGRATPTEYSDWLDGDFDLDVLPARRVGAMAARFRCSGRAVPTPYDFDE